DDVRAVLDATGSSRAALIGVSEGGPMSLLYAATYPERTSALVLYGSYARRAWAPGHPFGVTSERMRGLLWTLEKEWGASVAMEIWSPSMLGDDAYKRWRATYLRLAASPGASDFRDADEYGDRCPTRPPGYRCADTDSPPHRRPTHACGSGASHGQAHQVR